RGRASAGRGAATANPRVPTLLRARKATRFGRTIARSERPGVVEEPGMCRSSLDGNREIPRLASCGAPLWPASGRRGAVADDERTWEDRRRVVDCPLQFFLGASRSHKQSLAPRYLALLL